MRLEEAIIQNGYVCSSELLTPLSLASDSWQEWLETNQKFKLIAEENAFTAFKDKRGYWTAQKRVNGKLNQKRLGNSSVLAKLSIEDLEAIARDLCKSASHIPVPKSISTNVVQDDENLQSELRKIQNKLSIMQQGQQGLERKIMQLESEIRLNTSQYLEEAVYTLTKALELKSNSGGAIKDSIRKALDLIHLSRLERSPVQSDPSDRNSQEGQKGKNS